MEISSDLGDSISLNDEKGSKINAMGDTYPSTGNMYKKCNIFARIINSVTYKDDNKISIFVFLEEKQKFDFNASVQNYLKNGVGVEIDMTDEESSSEDGFTKLNNRITPKKGNNFRRKSLQQIKKNKEQNPIDRIKKLKKNIKRSKSIKNFVAKTNSTQYGTSH